MGFHFLCLGKHAEYVNNAISRMTRLYIIKADVLKADW